MNTIQNYGVIPNNANLQKNQNVTFGVQLNRADVSKVAIYAKHTNQLPELYTMLEYLKELPGKCAEFAIRGNEDHSIKARGYLLIDGKEKYCSYGQYKESSCAPYIGIEGKPLFDALKCILADCSLRLNESIIQSDIHKNRHVTIRDIINQAIEGKIESPETTWEEMTPVERGWLVKANLDKLPHKIDWTRDCGEQKEVSCIFNNGGSLDYYENTSDNPGKVNKMLGYLGPKIDI